MLGEPSYVNAPAADIEGRLLGRYTIGEGLPDKTYTDNAMRFFNGGKVEVETEMVLMVTHGIEEAVSLADRILVLGNPPGPSAVSIMDIDLPRPRIQLEGADGIAHRSAQQQLLSLLEIPAA